MKVSEFKTLVPGAPQLPDELPDDYPIEQYWWTCSNMAHLSKWDNQKTMPTARAKLYASLNFPLMPKVKSALL